MLGQAWALIGYPQAPRPVTVVKVEAPDRHTEEMCILEDGARIPRRYVYQSKPRQQKVRDEYGEITVWAGKPF